MEETVGSRLKDRGGLSTLTEEVGKAAGESVQTTLRTCPGLMGYSGDPCRHRGRETVRYMLSSQPPALYIYMYTHSHVDEGVAICGHGCVCARYAGRLRLHIFSLKKNECEDDYSNIKAKTVAMQIYM